MNFFTKIGVVCSMILLPALAKAQDNPTTSELIDQTFKKYTGWFVDGIFATIPIAGYDVPWVLIVLIGGAIFFTLTFRFVQFRLFSVSIKTVRGKYEELFKGLPKQEDIPKTIADESIQGEVTHFQALSAALSATVGLGNIAGVAVAISIGGPGATFWMIVAGLLGMASKFAECTLGVKYRDIDKDGTVYGGPMYYISKGLKEKGWKNLGKLLAVVFAIMVVGGSFGGGNMFQSNQAAAQFVGMLNLTDPNAGIYFGLAMSVIVALVIIGGIKRIASVTEKIVPFMAILYVVFALAVIIIEIEWVPKAFSMIISEAFSGSAIAGGAIGAMIQGFRRGTFSNEAGVGSAAIAHSAVKTKYAASEGIVALLEPFIDTVVICTMTALVLVITNMSMDNEFIQYGVAVKEGVEITAKVFESQIPYSSIILTISVILFAFSTMISWSYYGMQGWKYLFGKGKVTDMIYKLLFVFFVVVGAAIKLGSVIDFSDAMIFAMVVPNMIGVMFLIPNIKAELKKYLNAIKSLKTSKQE